MTLQPGVSFEFEIQNLFNWIIHERNSEKDDKGRSCTSMASRLVQIYKVLEEKKSWIVESADNKAALHGHFLLL